MKDWYINKMLEMHKNKQFVERNNYAKMAGIDLLEMMEIINKAA